MGDSTFVAVVQSHHLRRVKLSAAKSSYFGFIHSHRHVEMVYHRGRATEIGEQWLWGYGKLRTGDLMCGRFVAGKCHQLVNDDKLGLRGSCNTQTLQYSQAKLVGPIVEHSAQEEDSDILLLHRLRVEEAMSLGIKRQCVPRVMTIPDLPWNFTRPISSASGMFFFQNCHPHLVRHIQYSDTSADLMHMPQLHPLQLTRDPEQRNEDVDDVWRAPTTASQSRLQHRRPASPRGGCPRRTL